MFLKKNTLDCVLFYITKQETIEKYGWQQVKNTLEVKAPGKMIGCDVYYNNQKLLPQILGRIWYESDVDYVSAIVELAVGFIILMMG